MKIVFFYEKNDGTLKRVFFDTPDPEWVNNGMPDIQYVDESGGHPHKLTENHSSRPYINDLIDDKDIMKGLYKYIRSSYGRFKRKYPGFLYKEPRDVAKSFFTNSLLDLKDFGIKGR